MDRYFAFVTKDDDSDYSVLFPDLPGCYSAGATLEEACDMAADALALHVAGLREEGETVPPPRAFADLADEAAAAASEDSDSFFCVVPVTLRPTKGKAMRVQVTLDENLLAAIDARAAETGETRSGFLAAGARRRLESENA